jgi:hypothetical protein
MFHQSCSFSSTPPIIDSSCTKWDITQTPADGHAHFVCLLISLGGVLLQDEPTTGMDPISRRHVWDIIEEAKKGVAFGSSVLSTFGCPGYVHAAVCSLEDLCVMLCNIVVYCVLLYDAFYRHV